MYNMSGYSGNKNIIPEQKSGFAKRVDNLRNIFILASAENDYEKMIKSLVQIMYEIQPLVTDKKMKDKLNIVKETYIWFFTLEKKHTIRKEFETVVEYPQSVIEEAEERILECNDIIMRNMHKLGLCKF